MSDKTKRKEWVKTAAIIFLSVLLVLTFFSNTIKNYSLPEVAAQYTNSGTITNKVRGQGTVDAADPYSVIYKASRKVESVKVKVGDEVTKGDVLYTLEPSESDELVAARRTLEELKSAYDKDLVLGQVSKDIVSKVESGTSDSTTDLQASIANAKKKLDNAKANLDALEKEKDAYEAGNDNDKKKTELTNEQEAYENMKPGLETAKSDAASELVNVASEKSIATTPQKDHSYIEVFEATLNKLQQSASDAGDKKNLIMAEYEVSKESVSADAVVTAVNLIASTHEKYTKDAASISVEVYDVSANDMESVEVTYANLAGDTLLKAKIDTYVNARNTLSSVNNRLAEIKNELTDLAGKDKETGASYTNKLADAKAAVEKAQKNYDDLISNITTSFNLTDKYSAIKAQEDVIAKLVSESGTNEILAPVSGTILEMPYVAGETTEAGEKAASIQVAGKGYTLSMTLTQEQAKLISVGDEAEIINSWWYSDVHARVKSIKPDPSNPASSKIALFELDGEVSAGQQLSLTVGKRSANYENIVPNSAIREDNNGKFILRVNSKSTPLGTRYIAERVNVTVLASDETQSAVSGDLMGWDYVITTSSKPIEDGTEVRLKD